MEDLLKVAGNVMDSGFDPAKDSANDYDNLPDGKYVGVVEDVTHGKTQSGNPKLSVKFEVTDGDHTGRKIWANFYFVDKMMEVAVKRVMIMVNKFGYELSLDSFKSVETLAEDISGIVGEEAELTLKTGKNDFQNVDVEPTGSDKE